MRRPPAAPALLPVLLLAGACATDRPPPHAAPRAGRRPAQGGYAPAPAARPRPAQPPHGAPYTPPPRRGAPVYETPLPAPPAPVAAPPPPAVGRVQDLPGWAEDDHAAAFAALRAGCGVTRDPGMQAVCAEARAAGPLGPSDARRFFETRFRIAATSGDGVLTAYFAPEYPARSAPSAPFTAPVRPRPSAAAVYAPVEDPTLLLEGAPAPVGSLLTADRATIEQTPAPEAVAWMRPEDLFFLQIQGSGTLVFPDGRRSRAAYAADNGRPFTAIARPMAELGLLPRNRTGGEDIRRWLADHAGPEADAVMRRNARYIFFALQPDDGRDPAGASGVSLPPGRSLAVDPSRHGYGELWWIDADAPILTGAARRYRRLAMALDTGSAIRGEVRADLYTGRGDEAGREAGRVRHTLRMTRLTPVPAWER